MATEFVFFVAWEAVSWKSKKQSVVTTSITEAEYLAMGCAAQECICISHPFAFGAGKPVGKPTVFVDRQRTMKMAKTDASGNHTKHIDLKYHLARDQLSGKRFKLNNCPSDDVLADIHT